MKITETIFDSCYVIEPTSREDVRGAMEVFYQRDEMKNLLGGFEITEQRIYKMPRKHTFFGIHYQKRDKARGKLVTVIQGRGLDYIVDLREDSPSYKQYKMIELDEKIPRLVYLPAGFGHAFLSMEDQTIQMFAIDTCCGTGHSGIVSYRDSGIQLKLPVSDIILSDYDRNAGDFIQ